MLLTQKLHALRETINEEVCFNAEMSSGFSEAICNAETLEEIKEEAKELLAYLRIHGGIDEVEGQLIVSRLNEACNRK